MFNIKVRGAGANKTAEVFLYEDIGDSFWAGGISAKAFADEIKALGKVNTINVRINSGGGNVFDGLAMYNTLISNNARIEVDIDGLAASIASIIAMAGDEIRISSNGMMMIHNASAVVGGNANDLRDAADLLQKVDGQLVNTYLNRTNVLSQADIEQLMAAETWMTADEALDNGFVTGVTDDVKMAASIDASKFKHVPDALLNQEVKPEQRQHAVNSNVALMSAKIRARKHLSTGNN